MKQGDQYKILIPYDIKNAQNADIPIADIESIQFSICKLEKNYPDVVTYDEDEERFEFPVTQSETYDFPAGKAPCQMRVHFTDGTIISSEFVHVSVGECLIKESANDG